MGKTVQVAAAVILRDGRVFAAQRGYGDMKGGWEFPGGKLEPGETAAQALQREIREELAIDITVGELLGNIEYDYPAFHLSMDCFLCSCAEEPVLKEASGSAWLTRDTLDSVDWLPADRVILPRVRSIL